MRKLTKFKAVISLCLTLVILFTTEGIAAMADELPYDSYNYDYRKYISPTYNQKFGRPKKDVSEKVSVERIVLSLRLDLDLGDWLCSHKNKCRYINSLIRKDMEEQMNKED